MGTLKPLMVLIPSICEGTKLDKIPSKETWRIYLSTLLRGHFQPAGLPPARDFELTVRQTTRLRATPFLGMAGEQIHHLPGLRNGHSQ